MKTTNSDKMLLEVLDASIKVLQLQAQRTKNQSQKDYLHDVIKKAKILQRSEQNLFIEMEEGRVKRMCATTDVIVNTFEKDKGKIKFGNTVSAETPNEFHKRITGYLKMGFVKEISF